MFQIKITGVTYTFNAQGYRKDMRLALEKQVKEAAVVFAKTALARIPVRTGFVAGAWSTLTDLLGKGRRFHPIVGQTVRYEFYTGGGGRVLKSPTSGRLFATPSDQVFTWKGNSFIFNYVVDINYFRINDQVPGHAPTAPWQAFAMATAAFEDELLDTKAGARFVKFEDYMIPKQVP